MKGFALLLTQVLKSYNIEPEQVQQFFNTAVEMAQKLPAVVQEFQDSMKDIRFQMRQISERLEMIEKELDIPHRQKLLSTEVKNEIPAA